MKPVRVRLQVGPVMGEEASLLVERRLVALWRHLRPGEPLTVRLGRREARLSWRIVRGRHARLRGLRLTPAAAEALGLTHPCELHARWVGGTLRLGPVVGVFALRTRNSAAAEPFGSESSFFAALCGKGHELGQLVVVFGPGDIDWAQRSVYGYTRLPGQEGWHRAHFPLPDVVYDRIQRRSAERKPELREVKRRLTAEWSIPLFPPGFLDKWEVYSLLQDVPDLVASLPATRRLRGYESLRDALKAWGVVYLKPTRGSLGAGIYVAERLAHGRYRLRFRRGGRARSVATLTVKGLWRVFRQYRKAVVPYIVQQGLDLTTATRQRFDVRALMQKDGAGEWQRTKMFARVAAPGRLTANISTGAEGVPVESVLRPLFPDRAERCIEELKRAALRVATAMEERLEAPIGELGVDLGVDREGRVWLIEVNSKPHRTLDEGSPERIRRSVERPLAYAQWLAGFAVPVVKRRGRRA